MTIEKLEKAKSLSVTIGRVTSQLDTLEKSTSLRIRAEYAHIQIDIENALLQEQANVIKAMLETFLRKYLEELEKEFAAL